MKQVNMQTAIKRYNNIMYDICREENAIEPLNNFTKNWTLRDMVSEMQYTLDVWNDEDSIAWADAHDEMQPTYNGRKEWLYNWMKEKGRMSRFINTYSPFIQDMECAIGHSSIYD